MNTQEQKRQQEKNKKGIFTEKQLDMAFKFYTKEQQNRYSYWEWVNIFWSIK